MLELHVSAGERSMILNPTVMIDETGYWLIDTGMPGYYEQTQSLIAQGDIDTQQLRLRGIVLTHQDIDHIGGLPEWLEKHAADGQLPVYAHEGDQSAINGTTTPIKFPPERRAMLLQAMPAALRESFERTFSGERQNVTDTIIDGQTLSIAGGLTVIHTPGHTPGHVSLYHHASKTLIAGDAMVIADGVLCGPIPAMTPDLTLATQSLSRLAAYDIETVIAYHGGRYSGPDVNKRIAELAAAAQA